MRAVRRRRTSGLVLGAAAALALPASAFADGAVFQVTAKTVVPNTTPVQLADQTQYVFSNNGFTAVFRESNGALGNGVVNYPVVPPAYRSQPGFTKTQLLAEADTGVQVHATCRAAAALTEARILEWQGPDPFYNYIPWQKDSAGFGDDPTAWIPVVTTATGVDLAALDDANAFSAACAGIGGVYTPADAIESSPEVLAAGTIALAVQQATAPLTAHVAELEATATAQAAHVAELEATATAQTEKISQLEAAKAASDRAAAAAQAAVAGADADLQRLADMQEALTVALPAERISARALAASGTKMTIHGPAGERLALSLRITAASARDLGLKSRVVARASATIGADGTVVATVAPQGAAARALTHLSGSVRVTAAVRQRAMGTTTAALTR